MLTVLGGCATTGNVPAEPDAAGGSSIPDRDRARVEVDGDLGFTVTEVVRINGGVRADYREAVRLLEQDRIEAGIGLLEQIVAQTPEVTAPHIDLGVAYGRLGDHEKAEHSLREALRLAPNHPVALNEMGILYRRTGRFDAARASYERALGVHPDYHYARRNLGVLCDLYLADLECALRQYERYVEIVSDDEQVVIWIADIRNRLGVVQ
jgi:Flp pilus assembly protein TadD